MIYKTFDKAVIGAFDHMEEVVVFTESSPLYIRDYWTNEWTFIGTTWACDTGGTFLKGKNATKFAENVLKITFP